jgi:short-subunit dehydrogenase
LKDFAIITGAASGIGLELARLFSAEGISLLLVDRDPTLWAVASLLTSENCTVHVIVGDLMKEETFDRIAELASGLKIKYLVNNAGIGSYAPFTGDSRVHDMISVNVSAPLELTKLFVKQIIENKGKILNVASLGALFPLAQMATYGATKAFILNFSQALAAELRPFGVTVTALCPGPTATAFAKDSKMEESRIMMLAKCDAKCVADKAFKDFMKGKPVVIPGFINNVLAGLLRFSSSRLIMYLSRVFMSRR